MKDLEEVNVNCSICQTPAQPGAAFCDNCGTPLNSQSLVVGSGVCPQCQSTVMSSEEFCGDCGASVTEYTSPHPQHPYIAPIKSIKNCAQCGVSLVPGNINCDNCGTILPTTSTPTSTSSTLKFHTGNTVSISESSPDYSSQSFRNAFLRRFRNNISTLRFKNLLHKIRSVLTLNRKIELLPLNSISTLPSNVVRYPLVQQFRFIHEPYITQSSFTYIGRETEVTDLAHRILFSNGGAILVTGYRGVGKTSFVNKAVEEAKELLSQLPTQNSYEDLLYIQFNLAREMAPDEIMHHLVRRTYQALIDHGLMRALSKDTQKLVDLAYRRTSVGISQKMGAINSSKINAAIPELTHSGTKSAFSVRKGWTKSKEEELIFLGYDDKAAEFDVIQLLHHLVRGQQKGWHKRKPIKVVIAFDELDKIDTYYQKDDKLIPNPYIDQVVAALKTILTTSGVVFVFIAGRDFYQRWQADLRRTDSVYDSVFAHQVYLPCEWDFPKDLIKTYQQDDGLTQSESGHVLAGYLRFHSRGITRRAYRSINQMIFWEGGQPFLFLDDGNRKRLQFYYEIDALLNRHDSQILSPIRERSNRDLYQDEYRSYTYRLVDTIIESVGRDFTGIELLQIGRDEIPLLSEYELANLTNSSFG